MRQVQTQTHTHAPTQMNQEISFTIPNFPKSGKFASVNHCEPWINPESRTKTLVVFVNIEVQILLIVNKSQQDGNKKKKHLPIFYIVFWCTKHKKRLQQFMKKMKYRFILINVYGSHAFRFFANCNLRQDSEGQIDLMGMGHSPLGLSDDLNTMWS